LVPQVQQELQAQLVSARRVQLDLQGRQAQLDRQARQVPQVQLERPLQFQDQRALQEQQDHKEFKASKAFKATSVSQDQLDQQELQDQVVQRARHQLCQDQRVSQVPLVHQVLEQRVPLDLQESLEQQVQQAQQDQQELEQQEQQDHLELLGLQVRQE
jgi:hypothetical protein